MKQSHILSKKFFFHAYRALAAVFSFVVMCGLGFALYLSAELPDRYYLAKGDDFSIGDNRLIQTAGSSRSYPLSVYSSAGNTFQMKLRLLGLIDIKDVSVQVVDRRVVSLCGTPFGIKMVTDGVMVVGTGSVTNLQSQAVNPAEDAGVLEGDVILSLNGEKISSKKQLTQIVSACSGQPISMVIRRGDELEQLTVSPVKSSLDNDYHLGLWVRDSSAGIGTVTYYDPENGTFGALGHGVCDSSALLPLRSGLALPAAVTSVTRGEVGTPGALHGAVTGRSPCGTIRSNTERGIFGVMTPPQDISPLPTAAAAQVHTGSATILSNVSGTETREYAVQIVSVEPGEPQGRNLRLAVTDDALLAQTGGIVQGMSGSPILQDGRLVGAVTHVLVNEPAAGYGILIENMLAAAG